MATLNLPILDRLAGARSVLVAGIGGGFDLFCGLPLYFHLRARGHTVHLANYSFADIAGFTGGVRLSETLVGVTADYGGIVVYFPELHLARWFREARQEEVTVWAFHKTGVQPLIEGYRRLVERLVVDAIILVDGGVDSLARGDEAEPGTFVEDTVSLAAIAALPPEITRVLACIGFGAEQEVTHAHILENIADLTRRQAFLGACALTGQMEEYRPYEEAVLAAHGQPFQDASVINASIISAARGEYGNYHLTEKTRGSRLWISPLMTLYWFFDFPTVVAQHALLPAAIDSVSFPEAMRALLFARRAGRLRRGAGIPL